VIRRSKTDQTGAGANLFVPVLWFAMVGERGPLLLSGKYSSGPSCSTVSSYRDQLPDALVGVELAWRISIDVRQDERQDDAVRPVS
jgi:hypothetical protein